jgi:ubiquinone biosynthesis protein
VLKDAFFHADPHPDNLCVRDGQIVWMDLGMTGELSDRDRGLFASAVEAIAFNDVYQLKDMILSIGEIHGEVDQNALYSDLDLFVSRYGKLDFKNLDLQEIVNDIKQILNRHHISAGKGLTMLIRGIITIESTIRLIAPSLDFLGIFTKYVQKNSFSLSRLRDSMKLRRLEAVHILKKTADIPSHITDLLKMTVHGQTKFNVQLSNSPDSLKTLNRIINRAIIALIDAALLIASSLICLTDMKGKVLGIPALGAAGYLLAIILGVYLLITAMKNTKP